MSIDNEVEITPFLECKLYVYNQEQPRAISFNIVQIEYVTIIMLFDVECRRFLLADFHFHTATLGNSDPIFLKIHKRNQGADTLNNSSNLLTLYS